jgi:hypothetical protein
MLRTFTSPNKRLNMKNKKTAPTKTGGENSAPQHSESPVPSGGLPAPAAPSGLYEWAVTVDVPKDWDAARDWQYLLVEGPPIDVTTSANCPEKMIDYIQEALDDFYAVLTFAFSFINGQEYAPDECLFRHLALRTRIELLRKLFHQRSQSQDYRERFDDNLKKLLDVETVCMPVLERWLIQPETVWLRELVMVSNNIVVTVADFSESMTCFAHKYRIDPSPRKLG